MKKLFTLLATLLVTATIWAQSPQKMSYQAVIRNSSNALITNTPVGMKISILQGSVSGLEVYSEIQTPTTNANGLISIEIGGGTGFDAIDWTDGPFFITTETDPLGGTDYTITGTSQLLSVPYALHSKTAESISGGITETDPVFVASPASSILSTNISDWNTTYGWGNHAAEGYLKSFTETDPIWTAASTSYYTKINMQTSGASQLHFNNLTNKPTSLAGYGIVDAMTTAHAANAITSANITNWNTAYGWGNHAGLYRPISYLPAWNEITSNPFLFISVANNQLVKYNSISGKWENWTANFLTSFTETDPVFAASTAKSITGTNISNWNTAYGWGNHANAGYLTSEVDGSSTNEIQSLSISNDSVYLSDGGFIKLPSANAWSLTGNAGTLGSNFIGTTDNISFNIKVNNQNSGRIDQNGPTFFGYQAGKVDNGISNTGFGYQALSSNTTGPSNSAIGSVALQHNTVGGWNVASGSQSLQSNTTGGWNNANGTQSLMSNSTGNWNNANGTAALSSNSTGNNNTASGSNALWSNVAGNNGVAIGYNSQQNANNTAGAYDNTNTSVGYQSLRGSANPTANTGTENTAIGRDALFSNSSGYNNTASGYQALFSNVTGYRNTADGYRALYSNISGNNNTASGPYSLFYNTTGYQNSANGSAAIYANTSGYQNTASGNGALYSNTTGNGNTVSGVIALSNNGSGNYNTAIGMETGSLNLSGSSNVFLGYQAGFNETGSNKLYIANSSVNPPLIYGDFATGNIGLGTTSPNFKLESNGSVLVSGFTPSSISGKGVEILYHTDIDRGIINSYDYGISSYKPIEFGASSFSFTQGNVGIGVPNPSSKLDVNGDINASGSLYAGGNLLLSGQLKISSGNIQDNNNFTRILFSPTQTSVYDESDTPVLNLKSGNVGIGTDTPAAKLDVNGDLIVRGNFYAPGTVVQTIVRTSEVTSSLNVAAFTEADQDYRISITPKYTNSIILIEYNFSINTAMSATTVFHMQLVRDIGVSDELVGTGPINGLRNRTSFVSRPSNGQDVNDLQNVYMVAKDAGLTTGITYTYGFKYRREPGGIGTCYFNASYGDTTTYGFSGVMTMKATEIAQ